MTHMGRYFRFGFPSRSKPISCVKRPIECGKLFSLLYSKSYKGYLLLVWKKERERERERERIVYQALQGGQVTDRVGYGL